MVSIDFQKRLNKLTEIINEIQYDALLIEDPINLYYLTGLHLSTGSLLVQAKGACLYVDPRYQEMAGKCAPMPVRPSPFDESAADIKQLAFIEDMTSYSRYLHLQKKFKMIGAPNYPKQLRIIKSQEEIDILTKAAKLGSQGFDFLTGIIKEGVTEEELAQELEIFWKQNGSKSLAFDPIIAFGSASSMPHYQTGHAALKKGDVILLDIGVNYCHYHSDMTRCLFFGSIDPKVEEIYQIVLGAQKAALSLCKPGTIVGQLDSAARSHIEELGYGDYFTHSLGHGIGLEVHELPVISNKPPYSALVLAEGMVLTIEPGIYLPGVGGIRIEDTVVITKDGHQNLTNRPKLIKSL